MPLISSAAGAKKHAYDWLQINKQVDSASTSE